MLDEITASPWKKPKLVLISKSKSIKRKCKSFSLETNCSINETSQSETFVETKKLNTNIFSVSRTEKNDKINEEDDMRFFFEGQNGSNKFPDDSSSALDENNTSRANDYLASLSTNVFSNVLFPQKSSNLEKKPPLFDSKYIPIDWSLKTRLRFCSKSQFKICNNLKSIHESQAIYNYSKYDDFYKDLNNPNTKSIEDLHKTLFCESINHWIFPYLPWLKLYPRNNLLNFTGTVALHADAQRSLLNSWTLSFKSLYNSLKCGQCPYFYLMTNTLMILFRAENLCGIPEIHAIITPTTKGIRKTLKDEGISFTMPLHKDDKNDLSPGKSDRNSDTKSKNIETETGEMNNENLSNNDKNENDDEDGDEPNEWLQQIGLTNFCMLSNNRASTSNEKLEIIDNKPPSTIYIEGSDVQALFNFILNSKIFIVNSGPLTGVPPTLISPKCFLGATIQKLKIQQAIVKNLSPTGDSITQYSLDLIGPIMPFNVHRLCKLFQVTQNGNFEMTANALDNSASFNCVKYEKNELKYDGCSLDESEADSLSECISISGASSSINSIILENETFKCY